MSLPQIIIDAIINPTILKNGKGFVLSCNQAYLHFHSITADKVIGFTEHDFLSQREADYHSLADKALFETADGWIQYTYGQIDPLRSESQRNIYKSIIYDPNTGERNILAVIEAESIKPNALPVGMHLTPRENAVLKLLAQGNSQKQIAQHLIISRHTVADYCKSIYQKLGVNSRTEAQLIAMTRLGLTP